MAAREISGIVTWLKGWFYDKTEITSFLNNKANQSDLNTTNGNITSLQSTVNGKEDASNKVTSFANNPSDTSYPSEKLVKNSLDSKIDKSQTSGLVKNDGTIDSDKDN